MAIALPLIVPAGEALATAAAYIGSAIVTTAGIHAAASAIDKEFAKGKPAATTACPEGLSREPPPDCAKVVTRIKARIRELKQRREEMLQDSKGLYEIRPRKLPPFGSWPGHVQQYRASRPTWRE